MNQKTWACACIATVMTVGAVYLTVLSMTREETEHVRYDAPPPGPRGELTFPEVSTYGATHLDHHDFSKVLEPGELVAIKGRVQVTGSTRPWRLSLRFERPNAGHMVTFRTAGTALDYGSVSESETATAEYEFVLKAPTYQGDYTLWVGYGDVTAAIGTVRVRTALRR